MSSTKLLPVVFTAQSKHYFYCRNAVCEFVLRQGNLPLNPFRVFEYFLDDRVDREIIRQGNNNLIRIADELWVFGKIIADGVLFEILYAKTLGKPVRYFTIDNRVEGIKEIGINSLTFEAEVKDQYKGVTRNTLVNWLSKNITDFGLVEKVMEELRRISDEKAQLPVEPDTSQMELFDLGQGQE
jgi:hypothetical protein